MVRPAHFYFDIPKFFRANNTDVNNAFTLLKITVHLSMPFLIAMPSYWHF
jgi:hypothetical protein